MLSLIDVMYPFVNSPPQIFAKIYDSDKHFLLIPSKQQLALLLTSAIHPFKSFHRATSTTLLIQTAPLSFLISFV